MLIFVFYSIFKLQFDQKKGPILLMAAVISAARINNFSFSTSLDYTESCFKIDQEKCAALVKRTAICLSRVNPIWLTSELNAEEFLTKNAPLIQL